MHPPAFRKCVLVTGGTRGIGRAIVHRLIDDGFDIGFTFRSDPAHAALASDEFHRRCKAGQRVHAFHLDLFHQEAVLALPEQVAHALGRLDALVNNAGLTDDGAFLAMTPDRWDRVLAANFSGTAALSLAAIPFLLQGLEPAVVQVTSLAGLSGKEGQVPYATSKGALAGWTQWLARRYGQSGLRVNAVAPGFIRTEMADVLEPSMYEHILQGTVLRRMGTAEEVADVVSFLLRPGYLQATTLRLDGGFKC